MTNIDIAQAYFKQAGSICREIDLHFSKKEWNLVVRRAQEVVELILKGMLRRTGIEVPKLHDVGSLIAAV